MSKLVLKKGFSNSFIKFDNGLVFDVENKSSFVSVEDAVNTININVKSNIVSTLFLTFDVEVLECEVKINVSSNATLNLVVLNNFENVCNNINVDVLDGGVFNLYSVDLSKQSVNNLIVNLNGDYATCNINTTTLSNKSDVCEFSISTNHNNKATESNCVSRAVVFKDSSYNNKTVGFIEKGMSHSKCHQDTKAIIFDPSASAKCDPVLLIDEYDVEASHAAAVGQIDQEELYYLQSRGLSYNECISLLVHGFVVGVLDKVEEEYKEVLINEINKSLVF